MTVEIKAVIRTGWLISAQDVDNIVAKFNVMKAWCISELGTNTWEMGELFTGYANPESNSTLIFTHTFRFYNSEDACAFKLKFGILDQCYEYN